MGSLSRPIFGAVVDQTESAAQGCARVPPGALRSPKKNLPSVGP